MKKQLLTVVAGLTLLTANISSADEIEAKYNQSCAICHSEAMAPAMGSPMAQNLSAWDDYLLAQQEWNKYFSDQGISSVADLSAEDREALLTELVAVIQHGKGAMTPGGMCMDCSDDDYKALIQYMINLDN